MNIFVLDKDPIVAARMHADKHIVKMVLETAQLLSTAVKTFKPDADCLYKVSYKNHPCSIWARKSKGNFDWLYKLGTNLCDEYTFRYGKEHKSKLAILTAGIHYRYWIPDGDLTPFAQCMPDEYKVIGDPVQAYRNYYRGAKGHILTYTRREPPEWIRDIATHKS